MRVVTSIAATTIGEAIRRKIILVILLIGVLLCAIAPGLQVLSARQETTVLKSFIFGVMQLTGAAIAIVLTVYLIPTEIERRTIYTILCKPVRRWQFLLGKYLGAIGALGMMMALMTLVSLLLYKIMQKEAASPQVLAEIAKVPLMFYVQMCLLASIAVCLSTFVTPLVNFFLSAGVYMVGTVFSSVFSTFKENPNMAPLVKAIGQLVVAFIPNFNRFNIQNTSINAQRVGSETMYFVGAALYGVSYIVVALVIGMIIFERREV